MSVEAMAIVLNHSRTSGTVKVVMLGIANHDGDGGSWPTIRTLARYANVSSRNVQKAIDAAVQAGELAVDVQAGGLPETPAAERPNRYRILLRCPDDCDRTMQHRTTQPAAVLALVPTPPVGNDIPPPVADDTPPLSETTSPPLSQTTPKPSLEPPKNLLARAARTRGTRIPEDWSPSDALRADLKAQHPGHTATWWWRRVEEFRNHWLAASGQNAVKRDWDRAFRNWIIKAVEDDERRGRGGARDAELPDYWRSPEVSS